MLQKYCITFHKKKKIPRFFLVKLESIYELISYPGTNDGVLPVHTYLIPSALFIRYLNKWKLD